MSAAQHTRRASVAVPEAPGHRRSDPDAHSEYYYAAFRRFESDGWPYVRCILGAAGRFFKPQRECEAESPPQRRVTPVRGRTSSSPSPQAATATGSPQPYTGSRPPRRGRCSGIHISRDCRTTRHHPGRSGCQHRPFRSDTAGVVDRGTRACDPGGMIPVAPIPPGARTSATALSGGTSARMVAVVSASNAPASRPDDPGRSLVPIVRANPTWPFSSSRPGLATCSLPTRRSPAPVLLLAFTGAAFTLWATRSAHRRSTPFTRGTVPPHAPLRRVDYSQSPGISYLITPFGWSGICASVLAIELSLLQHLPSLLRAPEGFGRRTGRSDCSPEGGGTEASGRS